MASQCSSNPCATAYVKMLVCDLVCLTRCVCADIAIPLSFHGPAISPNESYTETPSAVTAHYRASTPGAIYSSTNCTSVLYDAPREERHQTNPCTYPLRVPSCTIFRTHDRDTGNFGHPKRTLRRRTGYNVRKIRACSSPNDLSP